MWLRGTPCNSVWLRSTPCDSMWTPCDHVWFRVTTRDSAGLLGTPWVCVGLRGSVWDSVRLTAAPCDSVDLAENQRGPVGLNVDSVWTLWDSAGLRRARKSQPEIRNPVSLIDSQPETQSVPPPQLTAIAASYKLKLEAIKFTAPAPVN
eukprot:gene9669-biopygen7672